MILEWLRAELASIRFSSDLKRALKEANTDEKIITQADITSDDENKKRLSIIKNYRGWFETDVDSYDWQLVELNQNEVGQLKYIDYDYWNELSSNTRLVKEATENVRKGVVIFDVPNDNFHAVADAVASGHDFPPIIVIRNTDGAHEIVEGHVRATGYALADNVIRPLVAIVGISKLS